MTTERNAQGVDGLAEVSVTDAVERLLYALEMYSDARAELGKCRQEAGYEAGYFCQRYSDAANEAQQRYADAFVAAVKAALAKFPEQRP